jgi:predicted RNase H-like HicB family nuclease
MTKQFKVVVEKYSDGYVAYPLGVKGVVVAEGKSYESVLAQIKIALQSHVSTYGRDVIETYPPVVDAFVAETIMNI